MTTSILFCFALFSVECHSEIFSSVAEMEMLVESSKRVADIVQAYVDVERQRLEQLQSYAQHFTSMYKQNAQFFKTDFLVNPTAAYLIAKIVAAYWTPIFSTMMENRAQEFLHKAKTGLPQISLPNSEDIVGLAKALMILQTTYQLNTEDLADGKLPGLASPVVMTARDCFDVGRVAYERRSYFHTVLWMQEALERSGREKPGASVNESEILEYLAYPMGELGDIRRALELTRRLLALVPGHPIALRNIAYYEGVLANSTDQSEKQVEHSGIAKWNRFGSSDETYDHYSALCRGEIGQPADKMGELQCYYKTDTPFLKLAPIKVELLLSEPKVRLFRRVISDREIEAITQDASNKLNRSMVIGAHGGQSETSESRISKNTWISDKYPVVAAISKRVFDMTGLDVSTAEEFQVANYGIGGYYQLHIDMLSVDAEGERVEKKLQNAFVSANGDRIATVLFYISQPLAGGATVFPQLNLALFPSKHNAVFWYNYKKNGRADMRMRHSGCPVLTGSKWILNKWIHERGQEFIRPCGIEVDAV